MKRQVPALLFFKERASATVRWKREVPARPFFKERWHSLSITSHPGTHARMRQRLGSAAEFADFVVSTALVVVDVTAVSCAHLRTFWTRASR
jgi:hypothetical protein